MNRLPSKPSLPLHPIPYTWLSPGEDLEWKWLERFGEKLSKRLAAGAAEFQGAYSGVEHLDEVVGFGTQVGWTSRNGSASNGYEIVALFDRFSGHAAKMLWVGVIVSSEELALAAHSRFERHGLHPRLVQKATLVSTAETGWRLAQRLPKSDFGRPIIQLLDGQNEKLIGVYLEPPKNFRLSPEELIDRATRVLLELGSVIHVVRGLPSNSLRKFVDLKRARVSTQAIARNSTQAKQAKSRDNYTCRLCGFFPEKMYGLEGRGCLEAHHLDELGGKRSVKSDLERLITVCANCHRVLHVLPAEQRTVTQLRRRFKAVS
jgi:hypothetical protein